MTGRRRSGFYLRIAFLLLALLLPTLSLLGLGFYWLAQNGYVLHWAAGAAAMTSGLYLLQNWRFGKRVGVAPPGRDDAGTAQLPPDGSADALTPAEIAAWEEIEALALAVDPEGIKSKEDILALGRRTVEVVASKLHPGLSDPLLRFTVPEALALCERVAVRLRDFVNDNIPLGDQVTVGQAMRLYQWRSMIGYAEKAYDVWRVVRLINPAAAASNEVRERLSKLLYGQGRDLVARRLAAEYVREVGRAAIDLYGGRLKIDEARLREHVSPQSVRDLDIIAATAAAEPLRIFVTGQVSVGKSSLINALSADVRAAVDVLPSTDAVTPYQLSGSEFPAALILDSPGLADDPEGLDRLITHSTACDLVIWVVSANRAARELDRKALDAFRAYFAERVNGRRPPIILVLTHIDQLRPVREWSPPYDLNRDAVSGVEAKAASIRAAIEAVCEELGFAVEDIVPVRIGDGAPSYNVDAVWAKIHQVLPVAQQAQLVRRLRDIDTGLSLGRLWKQTVGAGRVLTSAMLKR